MNVELQKKVDEAIERHLGGVQPTILGAIHHSGINDAQRVACIAQNIYALSGGFFDLLYDQFIMEEMLSGEFVDFEGNKRQIEIDPDMPIPYVINDDRLMISQSVWDRNNIQGEELKSILSYYFCGDDKAPSKALSLRLKAEFGHFSSNLNKQLYEYDQDHLKALALTLSELGIKFILPLYPNFCSEEELTKMYSFAYDSIILSMDDPSEQPMIRAFNSAVPNSLFLDMRAGDIYRIALSSFTLAAKNKEYQQSVELDYMTRCMGLVHF